MPGTPSGKRRPRGALLQPGVALLTGLQSVGGRLRSRLSGGGGAANVTPPSSVDRAYLRGQRLVGSLAGAVRLRKGNIGAQRSAQAGQKSAVEGQGHMPA